MATEQRLIDANALVDTIEDIDWYHVNKKGKLCDGANPANNTPLYKAVDIYQAIANAPTVDAVEVVRCKDCKYNEHYDALLYCEHTRGLAGSVSPNAFCSYGERRIDG